MRSYRPFWIEEFGILEISDVFVVVTHENAVLRIGDLLLNFLLLGSAQSGNVSSINATGEPSK